RELARDLEPLDTLRRAAVRVADLHAHVVRLDVLRVDVELADGREQAAGRVVTAALRVGELRGEGDDAEADDDLVGDDVDGRVAAGRDHPLDRRSAARAILGENGVRTEHEERGGDD